MIDESLIVARLNDQVADLRGRVEATLDFAQLAKAPVGKAVAYVVPSGDRAGPPGHVTGYGQRHSHTILVLIGVAAVNTRGGAGAVDDLRTLREAVIGALRGWAAAGWDSAMVYASGRLLAAPPGGAWWGLFFTVDIYEDDPT